MLLRVAIVPSQSFVEEIIEVRFIRTVNLLKTSVPSFVRSDQFELSIELVLLCVRDVRFQVMVIVSFVKDVDRLFLDS